MPYVLRILNHLIDEIEHHGNLPDPRTIPPGDPDPRTAIPDRPPPWNCVPGRPPAFDRRVPEFREAAEGSPHFDGIHLDHPESERLYDWLEFVDELAFRYDWRGYPTVEARILQHAFAEGVRGLPDGLVVARWTRAEMAAARACCERHLRRHPDDLPPFPPRDPRPYDTDAGAANVAAFARACENLRLVPEDVLVLALHSLCAADAPAIPGALRTLGLVLADIEIHGNVRDPGGGVPNATADSAVVH